MSLSKKSCSIYCRETYYIKWEGLLGHAVVKKRVFLAGPVPFIYCMNLNIQLWLIHIVIIYFHMFQDISCLDIQHYLIMKMRKNTYTYSEKSERYIDIFVHCVCVFLFLFVFNF